jgi:hypothetical protein
MKKLIKIIPKEDMNPYFTKGKEYMVGHITDNYFRVFNDNSMIHEISFNTKYSNNFELIYEYPYQEVSQASGLTTQELKVMDSISQAYHEFLTLDSQHPNELTDFVNAIHTLQGILAMRVVRRGYSDYWLIHKGENND